MKKMEKMEKLFEALTTMAETPRSRSKGMVQMPTDMLYTGAPTEDLPSIITEFSDRYDQMLFTVAVNLQGTEVERVWAAQKHRCREFIHAVCRGRAHSVASGALTAEITSDS